MSPEILARKLSQIGRYLRDLHEIATTDYAGYLKNHYAVERLIELLIISAVDVLYHLYSLRNEPPAISYGATFLRAGELDFLDADLAKRLARAAGMRNLLVHGYEQIDHQIIFESIPLLQTDLSQFIIVISQLPELTGK